MEARSRHSFAEAAFFEEILFEPPDLLVEKVVGQLDQSDYHVGGDEWVGVFDAFLEGLVVCAGLAVELPEATPEGERVTVRQKTPPRRPPLESPSHS